MDNVYNLDALSIDGVFKASPGQEITEDLYNKMRAEGKPHSLPKTMAESFKKMHRLTVRYGFLAHEPIDNKFPKCPLYRAFGVCGRGRAKRYYYLGLSLPCRNGTYYQLRCMNAFVDGKMFKEDAFGSRDEAIAFAANYEATLTLLVYDDGTVKSSEAIYTPGNDG